MGNLETKKKSELIELVQQLEQEKSCAVASMEETVKEKDAVIAKLEKTLAESAETIAALKKAADGNDAPAEKGTAKASQELVKLRERNAALLGLVEDSCKDHCPHHQRPDACRNCAIKQRLDAVKQ